jgi:predicted acylesterase/phospholipase RssA
MLTAPAPFRTRDGSISCFAMGRLRMAAAFSSISSEILSDTSTSFALRNMRFASLKTLAVAITIPAALLAQVPDTANVLRTNEDTTRIALTVSGGVSLGNYQAGATFAFVRVLRNGAKIAAGINQDLPDSIKTLRPLIGRLDVITGASAGNVNGLLAALDYCDANPSPNPEETIFKRLWVPTGISALLRRAEASKPGELFTQSAFDPAFGMIVDFSNAKSARPNCEVVVGLTATKLTPVTTRIVQGVDFPVQRHAGVFRVVSDSLQRVRFAQARSHDVDSDNLGNIILLDPTESARTLVRLKGTAGEYEVPAINVRALVEASGAFPIAFPPKKVSYQPLDSLRTATAVRPCKLDPFLPRCEQPVRQLFVDGGVFDNRPMGLALGLGDAAIRRKQALSTIDEIRQEQAIKAQDLVRAQCVLAEELKGLNRDTVVVDSTGIVDSSATAKLRSLRLDSLREYLTRQRGRSGCQRIIDAVLANALFLENLGEKKRLLYYVDEEPLRGAKFTDRDRPDRYQGLASFATFAANVLGSSSNAELRTFSDQLQTRKDVNFAVNSRWAPLMAEHVQHFGAFFHEAFRELDFYTGVYDGIRSGVRELICRPGLRRAAAPELRACEVEWTRAALKSEAIVLPTHGRNIIQSLLASETEVAAQAAPVDDRSRVLLALMRANLAVRDSIRARSARNPNYRPCDLPGKLEGPLCELGLATIVQVWKDSLDAQPEGWRQLLRKAQFTDTAETRFVEDPVVEYNNMVMELLQRLLEAEYQARRSGMASADTYVRLASYVQRAYMERFRSCWQPGIAPCADPNPTSADVLGRRSGLVSRILPQSITWSTGGHARWETWRPTVYAWRASWGTLGMVAPLELRHSSRGSTRHMGFGVHIVRPATILSGVTTSWVTDRIKGGSTGIDATVSLLSNVVRVGWHWELTGQEPEGFTLGIGDANGLGLRLARAAGSGSVRLLRKLAGSKTSPE